MTEFRNRQVRAVLDTASTRFGWDGFVYSFILGLDWTEPGAAYVREASPSLRAFLPHYRSLSMQRCHHRLSIVLSDLPRRFEVAQFSAAPLDRKLAQLMLENGWRSGMVFPQYGYGGALGLTTFVSRAETVDDDRMDGTVAYMAGWQAQLNAWARQSIGQDNAALNLSPREIECLLLVSQGRTSRDISQMVGIAKRTVEFHIQNAMHKLGGASRSQAASKLMQMQMQMPLPQLRSTTAAPVRDQRQDPDCFIADAALSRRAGKAALTH